MLSSKPLPPVASRPGPVTPAKPGVGAVAITQPARVLPVPAPASRAVEVRRSDPDRYSPFRKPALFFGIAAIFVRFSVLPEVIAYLTGVNTYLLYVTAVPALVACALAGGFRSTFRAKAPYWCVAWVGWMFLAVPFSSWPGDSTRLSITYLRTDLVFLFIAGGLVLKWNEIRPMFYAIAAAAVVNLATSRLFTTDVAGRASLRAAGSIGNSNDLAAHLLLVLPFLLFITMDPRRSAFIRIPLFLAIVYGINVILRTASRGGLIALLVGFAFVLLRATPAQRVLALGGGALLMAIFMTVLPSNTLSRLGNLFGEKHEEAEESGESRDYLFRTSVAYTIQHPWVGVGPGQFANYEGNQKVAQGKIGNWHETHCTFTEISSECGIPALIFFLAGLGSAIGMVFRVHRKARLQGNVEIKNACFCYLLAIACYLTAATFLSHAYTFYWPVMIGIGISLSFAANQKLEANGERPRQLLATERFA
jgi:O-antigen ligase